MSDKVDGRRSVANELYEAIQTFDAVPMSMDLAPEHWRPSYTKKAESLHSSLEKGMKWMCVDGELTDCLHRKFRYEWRHDLPKIYRGLSKSNSKLRELLDGAFTDAVSFYQIDRKEWTYLCDLKIYLKKTGTEEMYQKFRYWHSDRESDLFDGRPLPDLLINREMVRFIYDVLDGYDNRYDDHDGGPFFVSQLVEREIRNSLYQESYGDNRILWQWVARHDSLLLAIKDAYEHDFDVLNEWSNTVLKGVYDSLKETDDYKIKPALDYAFSTFGAKTSNCDREVISSAQVQIHQDGRRGTVRTPSGQILGNITKRHDGLWRADNITARRRERWRELAVSRNDAIGLVIENETETVSVALNDEPLRETRARFSKPYPYFGAEVSCEFWDSDHGIAVGDKIIVTVTKQGKRPQRIIGNVKSVNNHDVVIAITY